MEGVFVEDRIYSHSEYPWYLSLVIHNNVMSLKYTGWDCNITYSSLYSNHLTKIGKGYDCDNSYIYRNSRISPDYFMEIKTLVSGQRYYGLTHT